MSRQVEFLREDPSLLAFPFRKAVVEASIPLSVPGAYLLLHGPSPVYIGRSDQCLQTRLARHPLQGSATHVIWNVCRTPAHAFLLESAWFHRVAPFSWNHIHPARPAQSGLACPYCDERESRALAFALEQVRGVPPRPESSGRKSKRSLSNP